MTVAVRFGDPTESSGYGAHIYPGGSIQNLSITGTVNTTSGVRVYNITVHVKDCYISNVVGSNGIGLWFGSAWLSTVQDTVIQSNAGYDLWLGDASNSVMLMNCTFLSTNTSEGVHIVGGSNSITLLNCDFEGKKHGIAIDTSSATIDSLSIKGCNFESNTTFGITSTGAQSLNACSIENCRASGAGNGINLNYFNALRLDQLFMFDCDIAFGQVGQSSDIGKLHLTGTAALTGQTSSIRRRKITEPLYEENSTVGALAYTIDSSQYNTLELVLSAACTGVTFTTNNASKRGVGEELLFVIGNGGTATVGGAVSFPAAYKVASSVVIPAANKRTSIRFVKDSNNLWWESSRATDAG